MSTDFPKRKGKRSRSSSNEANNSFVKNVTSRVTGLLPSTITKWFSSPSSSTANGSAPAADSDSSTEDEVIEGPVTQPPSKRMRYSPSTTPGKLSNHYISLHEVNSAQENKMYEIVDTVEPCTSYSIQSQSPPGRTTYRRETNFVSMPVAPFSEHTAVEQERDNSSYKSQHSVSQMGPSIAKKRKSLFLGDSPSSNEASLRACAKTSLNTMKDSKQPCFKASLLGSPFYPGRTMYGGAASSFYLNEPNIKQRKVAVVNEANNTNNTISTAARRVMDLLEDYSSPLIEAKRIPQYTRRASDTTDSSPSLMNRIKSYKTQELHVPSVASFLRLKQRNRLMDSTASARQIMASQSSTIDQPYSLGSDMDQGTKSSKYTSKVTSRLTRSKRGENNDFENDILPPVNLPTGGLQIDQDNLPKFSFGTPIASKEKSPYGSTLPRFGLTASTPIPVTSTVTSFSVSKPIDDASSKKPNTIHLPVTSTVTSFCASKTADVASPMKPNTIPNDAFTFSRPIRISTEQPLTNSKFTFVSPDRSVAKAKDDAPCVKESTVANESITISKDWKCSDCWVSNKAEVDKCVCCGGKKPLQEPEAPAKCTVCKFANSQPLKDKCVNCEKVHNGIGQLPENSTESTKWKCEDCWVSNDDSTEKCVCCGGKNPKKPSTNVPNTQSTPTKDWKCDDCWVMNKIDTEKCAACGGLKPGTKKVTNSSISLSNTGGFKFGIQPASDSNANKLTNNLDKSKSEKTVTNSTSKQAGPEWRCGDCWVVNKSDVEKCVACGGAKPGAKKESSTNAPFKAADSTFTNLVQSQSDKWECNSCLVRNDSDKLKCVCCEAEKPGAEKKTETNKSFNFEIPTNTSFKFGIPNNQPEAAKVPEIKSITEFNKKVESETNNNSLSKTPSFSFSLPEKKSDTVNKDSIEKTKLGSFTFGMPSKPSEEIAPSNETISKLTQSPAVLSKANVEEKEKEQEVPKMPMLADEAKLKSMPALLFTPTTLSSADTLKRSPSLLSSMEPPENKVPASNPLLDTIATTTTSESQKQSTFTFSSGSSIKLNSNLFTSTSTTATATSALSFQPANTAALSPKTEATTTAGLFQKTETTAASAPLTSTAPIFSFGSTEPAAPTTQSQTDSKPKFNFSFGSNNKSETATIFKPAFGADDSSNKTATFTLPTGTSLSTGNVLSTVSSLPSGNSLTTTPAPNIFGAQVTQKENMWSTPASNAASTNLFVTNASTNAAQKPATFSFGSATPFNASGSTVVPAFGSNGASSAPPAFGSVAASATMPAFGSGTVSAAAPPAFGSTATSPPTFGSATVGGSASSATSAFGSTPSTNVFGLSNQNSGSQPSLFSSPVASPFGGVQTTSNPPAALGIFGTPSAGATPTFGAPNPSSIPTFEAPSLTPAPAPAFSFGQPQSSAIFGFGQQQQAGVYSFGTAPGASPVQFNMGTGAGLGSTPSTAGRKIRKATRRANNPR